MRRLPLLFLCFYSLLSTCGRAQNETQWSSIPVDTIDTIFPEGMRIESENFTGAIWVERIMTVGEGEQPVAVGNVAFPPKSRSNWHHHPSGQSLLVLGGVGYYQQRGEPVRVLQKGQTVQCPPNVEHWHGAANDAWFVQLAMTSEHPDGRVIWGEPVTDKQYHAGLTAEGISLRYLHLARVAALATLGDLAELETALALALDADLTIAELREALVHLYAYAGFPRSIQGLKTLMVVLEDRQTRGIIDQLGAAAGAVQASKQQSGDRYAEGLSTLEKLTGRSWTEPSDYGKFAPRIDVFLKEHLFADVFTDTTLSYADREVITVAVLATLGEGVEPMLRGHSNIARRQGVNEAELRMIIRAH